MAGVAAVELGHVAVVAVLFGLLQGFYEVGAYQVHVDEEVAFRGEGEVEVVGDFLAGDLRVFEEGGVLGQGVRGLWGGACRDGALALADHFKHRLWVFQTLNPFELHLIKFNGQLPKAQRRHLHMHQLDIVQAIPMEQLLKLPYDPIINITTLTPPRARLPARRIPSPPFPNPQTGALQLFRHEEEGLDLDDLLIGEVLDHRRQQHEEVVLHAVGLAEFVELEGCAEVRGPALELPGAVE